MQPESYLFQQMCILRTLVSERASYSAGLRPVGTTPRTQDLLDSRHLTTEDMRKVNLATIRERFYHCRWPGEAMDRFFGADSIVLPDGYEGAQALGEVVTHTAHGRHDHETGKQAGDQLLTSGNLASAVSQVHGYKLLHHFQCLRSPGRSEESSVSAWVERNHPAVNSPLGRHF